MTLDIETMTADEAAQFVALRDARNELGEDAAEKVRTGMAAYIEAQNLIHKAVIAIFGESPYAGHFGWWWRLDENENVVISPWTYGGHMDSQKQTLSDVTFPLERLDEVVAGILDLSA